MQALLKALIGLDVKTTPEWPEYEGHNVRRNAIVHEGQDVEMQEAEASVAAVRALTIRMANAALEEGLGEDT